MTGSQDRRRKTPFSHLGELLDASALGIVTLLLLGASFFATWRGMGDFIKGNDLAAGTASQSLVLLIVVTLTLAMYVALREMISPYYVRGWWSAIWKRVAAGILYVILALWSVGFGYGFWWSLLAGQEATEAELTRSIDSLREETSEVRAGLAAAASVMSAAERLSDSKAEQERARGGTCGISSPPGDGPLTRARLETQSQIASLSASVQSEWLAPMVTRLDSLNVRLGEALDNAGPAAGRKARFEALGREAQATASELSADARARGRTIAAQLRSKADQLSAAPVNGRVTYCYDPDLATGLRAAADELDQDFRIEVAAFRYSEGAEGVARAVEDLWSGLLARAGVLDAVPPAPVSGRSLIALMATIGVDFALFIFGLLRGGSGGRDRRDEGPTEAIGAAPADGLAAPQAKALEDNRPGSADPSPQREVIVGEPVDVSGETDGADEPDIIDAEFEPAETGRSLVRTFSPPSQVEDDERVDELLDRVRSHMEAMHSARNMTDKVKIQAHLSDALRQLEKIGYRRAGGSDQYVKPGLHEPYGEQSSDIVPKGQILRIVRYRFEDAEGRVIVPALVILSSGPER